MSVHLPHPLQGAGRNRPPQLRCAVLYHRPSSIPVLLQVLDIWCMRLPHRNEYYGRSCYPFDTAPLAGLTGLHRLVLRDFEEPCMWGLPPQPAGAGGARRQP